MENSTALTSRQKGSAAGARTHSRNTSTNDSPSRLELGSSRGGGELTSSRTALELGSSRNNNPTGTASPATPQATTGGTAKVTKPIHRTMSGRPSRMRMELSLSEISALQDTVDSLEESGVIPGSSRESKEEKKTSDKDIKQPIEKEKEVEHATLQAKRVSKRKLILKPSATTVTTLPTYEEEGEDSKQSHRSSHVAASRRKIQTQSIYINNEVDNFVTLLLQRQRGDSTQNN